MKKLVFTVTNDLNYDQRMIRICTSLQNAGYDVLLVGRKRRNSKELNQQRFSQKRLKCLFDTGKMFYIEYNLRLFFYLLFQRLDLICAIDLDTIVPCYFISVFKRKIRVYDAHELFCEMKEIVSRPNIYKVWKWIERTFVPKFKYGYTVNEPIRDILSKDYKVDYEVIMNVPILTNLPQVKHEHFIIYQGAVNHGRCFETLIPAFKWINCQFLIYGEGNFYTDAKELAVRYKVEDKIIFKGIVSPNELRTITPKALLGITLFENNGLSNYYSLANRFFDYIHAGIPQLCVDYPVYRSINKEFEVARLIADISPQSIADSINRLLDDEPTLFRLKGNCLKARMVYNWQEEEKKLILYYETIFKSS